MSNVPLPEPDQLEIVDMRNPGIITVKGYSADSMHAHAAAVSAADNARLREVLEFIAGHDLNGADDRAKAIICGLFITKAKKAIHGSQP